MTISNVAGNVFGIDSTTGGGKGGGDGVELDAIGFGGGRSIRRPSGEVNL